MSFNIWLNFLKLLHTWKNPCGCVNMLTTFLSCVSCREPGEQQANEHAQCKWPPDATTKNRAIRGAAQGRGG